MRLWTICAFKGARADDGAWEINDVLNIWLAEFAGKEFHDTRAALNMMLERLSRLPDWTILNEGRERHPPFREKLKPPWDKSGLSRIAFNAHGKHQRLIGAVVGQWEYLILSCGTKDRRGERTNPDFYEKKCKEALRNRELFQADWSLKNVCLERST